MASTSNVGTGTVSSVHRQPVVLDYAQSNQFKIFLPIFPTTEYFVVRATVPSVDLGQASQPTPLVDMPLVGDKLTYDQFYFTFLVDEKLQNYMELHNWLLNIGFPERYDQFQGQVRLQRRTGLQIQVKSYTRRTWQMESETSHGH